MVKTVHVNKRYSIVPLYALKCYAIYDKSIDDYIQNEHGIALFDKQTFARLYIKLVLKEGA